MFLPTMIISLFAGAVDAFFETLGLLIICAIYLGETNFAPLVAVSSCVMRLSDLTASMCYDDWVAHFRASWAATLADAAATLSNAATAACSVAIAPPAAAHVPASFSWDFAVSLVTGLSNTMTQVTSHLTTTCAAFSEFPGLFTMTLTSLFGFMILTAPFHPKFDRSSITMLMARQWLLSLIHSLLGNIWNAGVCAVMVLCYFFVTVIPMGAAAVYLMEQQNNNDFVWADFAVHMSSTMQVFCACMTGLASLPLLVLEQLAENPDINTNYIWAILGCFWMQWNLSSVSTNMARIYASSANNNNNTHCKYPTSMYQIMTATFPDNKDDDDNDVPPAKEPAAPVATTTSTTQPLTVASKATVEVKPPALVEEEEEEIDDDLLVSDPVAYWANAPYDLADLELCTVCINNDEGGVDIEMPCGATYSTQHNSAYKGDPLTEEDVEHIQTLGPKLLWSLRHRAENEDRHIVDVSKDFMEENE